MTTTKPADDTGSRKLGLSCAECRRSKLKCDRTFPCQSCIRRGCPGICPEGTLAATKGNKVLMAQAQRLTEQVKSLTARVQELEAALAEAQPGHELTKIRPMFHPHIKDEYDRHDSKDISEALGSLSLGADGQAKYHGKSAGSEYLQDLLGTSEEDSPRSKMIYVNLPSDITDLMRAFPFGLKDCPHSKSMFLPYIPAKERAMELALIYYRNVAWMYDPITYEELLTTIINPIYGDHGYATIDALHSHRLSVLFMVLAHGQLYDDHHHSSTSPSAEQYHSLARAVFSLDSILIEVTSATVQALFLVFRFIYDSDQAAKEERWLLSGLTARIAHIIGLQRDGAAWNLEREEVHRRRRLFWELFVWEIWSSLVHGRPGAMLIRHTDCQWAEDLESVVNSSGEQEMGFHAWKVRYSATCLTISVEHVFSTRAPPYSALLQIEKTIHQFPVPSHLRAPGRPSESHAVWSADPAHALQQYCALCVRESNLLYIHRSYFAQAIRASSEDPLKHRYGRSVKATYESACCLIASLRSLHPICPLSGYVWFFWSAIFSAGVVLGVLVVESPGCSLAKSALYELERVLPFFEEGSLPCRPPSSLKFLQRLLKRAVSSYEAYRSGFNGNYRHSCKTTNELDELEVVGGHKSVITPKSNTNSPSYLHREGDGSSSPPSHTNAAEMLIALRHTDGSPTLSKSRDFGMSQHSPQYQHQPFNKMMNPDRPPLSPTHLNFMDIHPPAPAETPLLASSSTGDLSPRRLGTWQPTYSPDRHHYSPPSTSTQAYVPYDDSVPMRDSGPEHMPYGYLPAQAPQDEIWRSFMLQYSNGH